MLIGVIADDFTGASDIANTLAKGLPPEGGLSTAQYLGVPKGAADESIEAGVISLKTRSIDSKLAVEQSLAALNWLLEQGCTQIVFKYCSTFDSTPRGNIGPVGQALANAMGEKGVVVCPAFPGAGRTVYQGHLFVFDQLLHESGMQNHPLNPMTDADIRRWLSNQCVGKVGHVPHAVVQQGVSSLQAALLDSVNADELFCVVDAVTDADLEQLGYAMKQHRLITGGSGVAMGLPRNLHAQGIAKACVESMPSMTGLGAILAGSCSGATRQQIEHHGLSHPAYKIDVESVMQGELSVRTVVDFITEHVDDLPLVYSSGTPDQVTVLQQRFGVQAVAEALDDLFADVAGELLSLGYTRLVVAGGETSSAVAMRLSEINGEEALRIGPEIDPGVPVLLMGSNEPTALALKSGNFGGDDFFEKAFSVMSNGEKT